MPLQDPAHAALNLIPADFRGRARARSSGIFDGLADELKCEVAAIQTFVMVEAGGAGFMKDGRPKILFERHRFRKLTGGRFDRVNGSVSNASPGGYLGGAAEYSRMGEAYALDPVAAVMSASWGCAQIMGERHEMAGYVLPGAMIGAFCDYEDAQLHGFANFIRSAGLQPALQDKAWLRLSDGYNGKGGRANGYPAKLAATYARQLAVAHDPDNTERHDIVEIQAMLNLLGYGPLAVDGWFGAKSRAAAYLYRQDHNLTGLSMLGPDMRAALYEGIPVPPPLPAARGGPNPEA
ncbi:N-acetylmuramidase domain-containing protein [Inquilinus sp. CA228]|uniref:N-acetylmuramidase domain-containing protein n=1 Tax=Inquilinus sp. CA228 TaxID=3455609 RepID=UPI003F8D3ECA